MTTFLAYGSPETEIDAAQLKELLQQALDPLGARSQVMAVVPDITRSHSYAGPITKLVYDYYGNGLTDVLPALGTHRPMTTEEMNRMYQGVPTSLFREHNWREDIQTLGEVPEDYVAEVTEDIYHKPWPAELNQRIVTGGHDLVISIGQVVPHEVIGMANYNKNLFVGTGGARGINESHFIGAVYGMERMMGQANTPLRQILNYAQDHFCSHLPFLFVLTVVDATGPRPVLRGLFVGNDHDCFFQACELSQKVNITSVPQALKRVIVNLDPEEFQSTWLGNKAIYRTRMAMADEGELIILGPGVHAFGEDQRIDQLIRQFGYRHRELTLRSVDQSEALQQNLSAAAHLMHGSSDGRFTVTYCPGHLSREEIEGVGYEFGNLKSWQQRLPDQLPAHGWIEIDGEDYYYIDNPALGLWCQDGRLEAARS